MSVNLSTLLDEFIKKYHKKVNDCLSEYFYVKHKLKFDDLLNFVDRLEKKCYHDKEKYFFDKDLILTVEKIGCCNNLKYKITENWRENER